MTEVVFMIISCIKNTKFDKLIWKSLLRSYKHITYVRLLGNEHIKEHYTYINNTLTVKCPDNYESLQDKVLFGIQSIYNIFPNIKFIIKIDDDMICNINNFLTLYENSSQWVYSGYVSDQQNSQYNHHQGKCQNNELNNQLLTIPITTYCSGPCYILNRQVIQLLSRTKLIDIKIGIAEDVNMGFFLQKHGIKPTSAKTFNGVKKDKNYICYYEPNLDNIHIVSPYCHGGLGNKLFQISAIYSHSLKYNKIFTINKQTYSGDMYTQLNYINTIFKNIPISDIDENTYSKYTENQPDYSTHINLPNYKNNSTFYGYFQNEHYFSHYRQEILDLFKIDKNRLNYLLEKYPISYKSYFIHIRTHCIIKNDGKFDDASKTHFINFSNYIQKCLKNIDTSTHFYCFFDNPGRVKKHYSHILNNIPNKTIVNDDELNSLYLMSLCKLGGICTNSTFSWWGSYLNENKNKQIFMPNKWLNNSWNCDIYQHGSTIIDV
jgi:hypothetical protein